MFLVCLRAKSFRIVLPNRSRVPQGYDASSTITNFFRASRIAPKNSGRSHVRTITSGFQYQTTTLNLMNEYIVPVNPLRHFLPSGKTSLIGSTKSRGPLLIGTRAIVQLRRVNSLEARFMARSAPPPVKEFVTNMTRFTGSLYPL